MPDSLANFVLLARAAACSRSCTIFPLIGNSPAGGEKTLSSELKELSIFQAQPDGSFTYCELEPDSNS